MFTSTGSLSLFAGGLRGVFLGVFPGVFVLIFKEIKRNLAQKLALAPENISFWLTVASCLVFRSLTTSKSKFLWKTFLQNSSLEKTRILKETALFEPTNHSSPWRNDIQTITRVLSWVLLLIGIFYGLNILTKSRTRTIYIYLQIKHLKKIYLTQIFFKTF